jgi:EmrB/QacA subfamily drug resistance transporter
MNDRATKLTALTIASLSSFITPFMMSSINIAMKEIGKELNADAVMLSWIATSYLLAAAVTLVPFGKLADIYGRKKIFMLGMSLFSITSLLCALSVSAPMLIFFRIFQGAGSAMCFATGIAILSSVYPVQERGKVLGIAVAAVYIGLSCGPLFGGLLTRYLGWQSLFLINLPFGVVIILLVIFKLKGEWKDAADQKFDLTGSIIYATAIFAFMYGISALKISLAPLSIILILTGLVGLAAFAKWERIVSHPVFEVNLFVTNRVYAFSCLAALINYCATFAAFFLLSLYLRYIKELTPDWAGMILAVTPVIMAIFAPFAGRLSDKKEPRVISSIGMGITALGLVLLILLDNDTTLMYIIVSMILLGLGIGLFSTPNMNAIMSSVDKRFYGIASASVGTMRLLGQTLSMGIVTLVFALFIGRAQITPEYYPMLIKSIRVVFIISSVLGIGGIYFSLYRGRLRPGE